MHPESVYRARANAIIIALVGKKMADAWWESSNRAFFYRTPNEQWEIDYMSVYTYLMCQVNGDYM